VLFRSLASVFILSPGKDAGRKYKYGQAMANNGYWQKFSLHSKVSGSLQPCPINEAIIYFKLIISIFSTVN
jgi:hypothetical protein